MRIIATPLRYVFSKYNVTVISDNRDWASLEDIELHPDKTIGPRIITLSDETEVHRDRKRTRIGLTTSAYKGNYTKGGKTHLPDIYLRIILVRMLKEEK